MDDSLSNFISGATNPLDALPGSNRRFKFHKRSQQLIRTHNETLSVAAMSVTNPDYSPGGIHG